MKCKRILINGRVQGVYFRASLQKEAQRLGLSGYVENLEDGRVRARVMGDALALEALIDWCWGGPPLASVASVEVTEEEEDGMFEGFEIRRKG